MAWVTVPGSNSIWQYDNAPTLGSLATGAKVHPDDQYYREANGTVAAGIRTYTPTGGSAQRTYVRCRKIGETIIRGELNKNYYDAKV
tara:strand:- start:11397 stop:11657 length:261 start_codon:yes stop_codon:yes gene_type:complete